MLGLYSLRPSLKDVHGNFLGPRYLLIGAENLHALVERGNHPIIERELMQTRLDGGVILGLHDFPKESIKPGRRGYNSTTDQEQTKDEKIFKIITKTRTVC